MEELLNVFSMVDPILMSVMVLVGYLVTDHLNLHKCLSLPIKLDKAHYVFLASLPVAIVYTLTAKTTWDIALISYLVANISYSLLIKQIISKFKSND